MGHSKQHYIDAAASLKHGDLGAAFGASGLDEQAVSTIHRIARFQDNAQLLGLASGNLESMHERGAKLARTIRDSQSSVQEKAKKTFDTALFLTMLDQQIADTRRDIAEIKEYFVDKYGDAWAEKLALEVLDPDEMPQRREGESMIEYRERVEKALIEKMTDENGNIKPEYCDHPDYEHLQRLAKKVMRLEKLEDTKAKAVKIENDPDLSTAEKTEEIKELVADAGLEERSMVQDEFGVGSLQDQAIKEVKDESRDDRGMTTTADASINSFLMNT